MVLVAIAATKGGSGKTTTTLGLADALVDLGYPAQIIDTDPQTSAHWWRGDAVRTLREPTEASLKALDYAGYVVIDTPPGAHENAWQAATVADVFLVVTRLTPVNLKATIQQRRMREPDLVVPTQYDRRQTVQKEALEQLREIFGDRVALPVPNSAVVGRAEAAAERIPGASAPGLAYADLAHRVTQIAKP